MSKKPTVGLIFFEGEKSFDIGVVVTFVFAIIFAAMLAATLVIPLGIGATIWGSYRGYRLYQNRPSKLEADAHEETYRLYRECVSIRQRSLSKYDFGMIVAERLVDPIPDAAQSAAIVLALELYDREDFMGESPPPPTVCNSLEGARYRDMLTKASAITDADLFSQIFFRTIRDCFRRWERET